MSKKIKIWHLILAGELVIFFLVGCYLHWHGACVNYANVGDFIEGDRVCSSAQNFLEFYGESYPYFLFALTSIYLLLALLSCLAIWLRKKLINGNSYLKIFYVECVVLLSLFAVWVLCLTATFKGQLCFFDSCEKVSLLRFILEATSLLFGFIKLKLVIFVLFLPFAVCYFFRLTKLKNSFLG